MSPLAPEPAEPVVSNRLPEDFAVASPVAMSIFPLPPFVPDAGVCTSIAPLEPSALAPDKNSTFPPRMFPCPAPAVINIFPDTPLSELPTERTILPAEPDTEAPEKMSIFPEAPPFPFPVLT